MNVCRFINSVVFFLTNPIRPTVKRLLISFDEKYKTTL